MPKEKPGRTYRTVIRGCVLQILESLVSVGADSGMCGMYQSGDLKAFHLLEVGLRDVASV